MFQNVQKSLYVVLFSLTAIFITPTTQSAHATIVPGDVNQDSGVNVADVIRLLAHLYNNFTLSEEALLNADVNLSGTVDIADAIYLLDYKFGFPPGPAPLYPPYCEVLDANGDSYDPPRHEPGTYRTNLGGAPFAGGFVSDLATINNPSVNIQRGASVCGDTWINSTGTNTDVFMRDDASLIDSTVNIVSSPTLSVQLVIRGDSKVSNAEFTLDNYQVNINDTDISGGTEIIGTSGDNSPLIFDECQVIGGQFQQNGGVFSPITINSSYLNQAAVFGSNGNLVPIFIGDSTIENDMGPTGPQGTILASWEDIIIVSSTLVNTSVETDYGSAIIEETISTGPNAVINGSRMMRWCVTPSEYYSGENCNSLSYNTTFCSFPLPSPGWPNCL